MSKGQRAKRNMPPSADFAGWMLEVRLVHHRGSGLTPIEISGREFLDADQVKRHRLSTSYDPRPLFGYVLNGVANRVLQYLGTKYDFNGRELIPTEQPAPALTVARRVPSSPLGELPFPDREAT